MTKMDIINEVIAEMMDFDREEAQQLKMIFTVKMQGFEIVQMETLPSVIVYDNNFIMRRFEIDMMAKGLKASTITSYKVTIQRFLFDINKNYRDVSAQDVMDYLAIRQYRDKISINYKGTIQRYLTTFYRWAFRKKHIDIDITGDIDSIKPMQKKKERLSDLEIEYMRDACTNSRDKALLELMLSTGMRVGEIASLNVKDIDFVAGTIEVYGEKTSTYRTGFLNAKAKKAVKEYLDDTAEHRSGDGALFINNRAPYGRTGSGSLEDIAKRLGKLSHAHVKTTVHVFRKTFASIMYSKTRDIVFVSKLLGHAGTDITIKYYLIDDVDEMRIKHKQAA